MRELENGVNANNTRNTRNTNIPPRGMDGSVFSDGSGRSEDRLEDSEGNGGFRKRGGRDFGEKRL